MNTYIVVTNEGLIFVRADGSSSAYNKAAEKVGTDNVNFVRLASNSELNTIHESNVSEVA